MESRIIVGIICILISIINFIYCWKGLKQEKEDGEGEFSIWITKRSMIGSLFLFLYGLAELLDWW